MNEVNFSFQIYGWNKMLLCGIISPVYTVNLMWIPQRWLLNDPHVYPYLMWQNLQQSSWSQRWTQAMSLLNFGMELCMLKC